MQRLSIGIDGYNFALPRGTGIATYGLNLARTLAAAGHRIEGVFGIHVGQDPALRETLLFDRIGKEQFGRIIFGGMGRRRWELTKATLNPRLSAQALDVPLTHRVDREAFADRIPAFDRLVSATGLFALAQRHFTMTGRFLPLHMESPPDIMHWTYPVPVRLVGARNCYTIHDLVPLRLPYTTIGDKPRFTKLLRACAASDDTICTVSEFSRQDIVDQLGAKPEQVVNAYQTTTLPPAIAAEPFEAAAGIIEGVFGLKPRSYFLFFGALEPKKNIGRLIEAYLGTQTATPLVMVGAKAWLSEGELTLLPPEPPEGSDTPRRIMRLDYQSRDLLLRLVRCAKAVLFPSIFEGFGLPVLEAMQLGTPVLTADRSALPEVAGDAALLVDPYEVGAIAEGIRRLDSDEALRQRLSEAGPRQAERFSQAAFLARLEAMYARMMDTPPAGA